MLLRDYLEARKITAPKFAAKLGVTPVMVRYLCHGQRMPSLDLERKILIATAGKVTRDDHVIAADEYREEQRKKGEAA